MSRSVAPGLVLLALELSSAACTIVAEPSGSQDGDRHDGDGSGSLADAGLVLAKADAAPGDADAAIVLEPDAGGGGDPGPPNLALNPGCEGNTSGWHAYNGSLALSNVARTGASSCRVCQNAGSYATLDDSVDRTGGVVGQRYRVSAFVRAEPGGTTRDAVVNLRQWKNGDPFSNSGAAVQLSTSEWREVVVTRTLDSPIGQEFDTYVEQRGDVGECFLIDDVTFTLLP